MVDFAGSLPRFDSQGMKRAITKIVKPTPIRRTAVFINSSRGEIVNEEDLVKILAEGKIFGAALDVYHEEPLRKDHPLLQFDNVLTTPHIGSAVEETRNEMAWIAARNMVNSLKGEGETFIVRELQDLVQPV